MSDKYIPGLVSVIMPTYKRSDKLIRAIESVLNQDYKMLELLLVNDNEPNDDFTAELVERVEKYKGDERFKLVMQEKHINGAVARNVGISRARGEYIAFLDDDDYWDRNKIQEQVKAIKNLSDEWGAVSCKYRLVNEKGEIIGKSSKYKDGNIYLDILNLTTDVTTCSLLLRHDYLDKAGYFDESLLRHQDFQLLVNFTYRYKLKEVDKYLLNIDVSDAQNRPDPEKLIKYKKAFFQSIRPIMNSICKSDRKCIYAMHKYELGYVCLKNGNVRQGLYYCTAILGSPKAFALAVKKTGIKIQQLIRR